MGLIALAVKRAGAERGPDDVEPLASDGCGGVALTRWCPGVCVGWDLRKPGLIDEGEGQLSSLRIATLFCLSNCLPDTTAVILRAHHRLKYIAALRSLNRIFNSRQQEKRDQLVKRKAPLLP